MTAMLDTVHSLHVYTAEMVAQIVSHVLYSHRITKSTRSTQRAQTSAERQHNRIPEWFLQYKLATQLWSESTRYFFDNPVNPDFGLLDPHGDPDRQQNVITWSLGHALPLQQISKYAHNFFSYPTGRQTNRPKWKHNLLLWWRKLDWQSIILWANHLMDSQSTWHCQIN